MSDSAPLTLTRGNHQSKPNITKHHHWRWGLSWGHGYSWHYWPGCPASSCCFWDTRPAAPRRACWRSRHSPGERATCPTPSPQHGQSSSGPIGHGDSSPTVDPDGSGSHSDSSASPPSQAPSTTPDGSSGPGDAAGSTPPGTSGERSPASSGPGTSSGRTHTVLPGESLWSITARLLPAGSNSAQIARSWPALYHANADVIGANPSLIRPGTVLTVPSSLAPPSTTTGGQNPSR